MRTPVTLIVFILALPIKLTWRLLDISENLRENDNTSSKLALILTFDFRCLNIGLPVIFSLEYSDNNGDITKDHDKDGEQPWKCEEVKKVG